VAVVNGIARGDHAATVNRLTFLSVLFVCIATVGACGSDPAAPTPTPVDTSDYERAPHSCAYECPNNTCSEATAPYACPAMGSWGSIPHEASCGNWNGQYPTVKPGQCTSSAPTGDAIAYAGTNGNVTLLPDGRKVAPAGADWVFSEPDATGGLTTNVLAVANTNFVLAVDTGYGPHAVRVVDVSKIGSGDPVVSRVTFPLPATINSGVVFIAPDLVYVATDTGVVQALKLDTSTGALTRDDARSIKLPAATDGNGKPTNWYASGVAASPDGKRLVVTSVTETSLLVVDVAAASPTFGQILGSTNLGASETFAVSIDPNDTKGDFAYVSMWDKSKVLEVDLSTPSAPKVVRTFPTKKDPEGVAFIDARYMVACGDLGDALTIIDRASGATVDVPLDPKATLYGSEPGAAHYDAIHHRLYVTLGGSNALAAYDVDTTKNPPTLTPLGHVPTGFWPSAVTTLADGTVVVANMRGRGTGPRPLYFDLGDSDIADRMRGSIQRVPFPSTTDLTADEAIVSDGIAIATRTGSPHVDCPNGVNDFPLPPTNTAGPSPVVQHVFIVVRENKAFDGIYGDFPNVNGEPKYVLKPNAMDQIWKNLRNAARSFALSDNYYTDAIYSTQGHVWATYGRSNDFNERTWLLSDGHSSRAVPGGGVIDVGQPIEGSLFDWLGNNGIAYDIRGEIDGSPAHPPTDHSPIDGKYPGGPFQNIGYNDLEKACYLAAEMRVFCNLGNVTYLTLPNDHTFGVSASRATPETYVATNDEATGMFLDALSHSPLWASSVVIITEDDPSQGGEHVDSHRTPLTVVSPWVKRNYVSKTHIDAASIHKMLAHFFAKPYANALVARAALPFDMFTSTPDYTPFKYEPRTYPLACGGGASKDETSLTDSWDFSREDAQPGLDAQVVRWMAGRQMTEMPTAMRERMERRLETRAWSR
jgi:hypothetical protein